MTTQTSRTRAGYAGGTASMQVDPEAPHDREVASESHAGAFPVGAARCASEPVPGEWVPDREERVVPDAMTALCRRCPGRRECLLWALAGQEQGYWAGTTTVDRQAMTRLGQVSTGAADRLQQRARDEATGGALHPLGEGSFWWYRRRGCRCGECKCANAETRAQERAKARSKATVAA